MSHIVQLFGKMLASLSSFPEGFISQELSSVDSSIYVAYAITREMLDFILNFFQAQVG